MNASTLYYVAANDIPSTSLTDKCIVLDLDLTCIDTQDEMSSLHDLKILSDPNLLPLRNRTYHIVIEDLEKPGIGSKYEFWGVTRPHLKEFLLFCFSYFKIVAVWSAGQRLYVDEIVDVIFKDLPKPHVVFSYDDIEFGEGNRIEKPLTKLINSNPLLSHHMSLENTMALDDNSSTFAKNPDNGILIPAYETSLTVVSLSRDDPSLMQLKYWLLQPEVVNATDVRKLDKSTIFTTPLSTYKEQARSQSGYTFS